MGWVAAATDGYEVAVEDAKVVCRNVSGKRLRAIPKQLKEDPVIAELRQLVDWLERHTAQCLETAERWLLRALPVPAVLIVKVWPDEAWREVLRDLVIVPVDEHGAWDLARAGFLRAADERGLGVVDLDGESVRLTAARVAIPHPVLLGDLAELREFGVELEVRQSLEQLYRETWEIPADLDLKATVSTRYSDAWYEQLRQLTQRTVKLGYQVSGGYAICRVHDRGDLITARVWVGSDDPSCETETGGLEFVDGEGRQLTLGQVGPVAWSEGNRMAAALYAGRKTTEEEQ
ncbi:DUF4132 domain-containing protein [Actinospica durhamensis]|uniref:DUF4132 domain-containing protein n=1 Tax=Actinospica durhamensis TaxID=1508375 RepID=A0A941EI61_9ACTN|nr:DUF4132 domain-containing protein [Actinospica durhamensis]MBR7831811.1 DUF4132 domain-containing protein [Actinospica durhamensis]